ncbi:MAG: winged helix-turn-helix domain-containing protein, partial [Solirubrobacteraceae bacterium]
EQEYLLAVAHAIRETGRATGTDVARRLGLSTRGVSSYRARLLERGTLVAEGEALVFAIPGMGDYVISRATRPLASPPSSRPPTRPQAVALPPPSPRRGGPTPGR